MRLSKALHHGAVRYGSDTCMGFPSRDGKSMALTYYDAFFAMQRHEQWLQETIDDEEAGVVAYLSSNSADCLVSMLACTNLSNMTVALLNTRWTPTEIALALKSPKEVAVWILCSPDFEDKARKSLEKLRVKKSMCTIPKICSQLVQPMRAENHLKESLLDDASQDRTVDSKIRKISQRVDDHDALIVFTSGTTSGAKGVRLSHRALWIQSLAKTRSPCRYNRSTRMLATTVPFFHVGGLSSVLAVLIAGGALVLPQSITTSFDPEVVLESTSHIQMPSNTLVVVPAMLHAIFQKTPSNWINNNVRLILIGGQSASQSITHKIRRHFPVASIVQTYACTEAASSLTFLEADRSTHQKKELPIAGDCVGNPPPHVELKLYRRINNNRWVPILKPFEIGVFGSFGPHVMNGYWLQKDSGLGPSGILLTSDLGFMDEKGAFYFCGRVKDVIRTGGETVLAQEVERVLQQHSEVLECAVFALPDDRFGETVCVAIVWTRERLTLKEVRSYCAKKGLSGYKRPRRVFSVQALPRNSSGKVLKRVLRDQFQKGDKIVLRSRL